MVFGLVLWKTWPKYSPKLKKITYKDAVISRLEYRPKNAKKVFSDGGRTPVFRSIVRVANRKAIDPENLPVIKTKEVK